MTAAVMLTLLLAQATPSPTASPCDSKADLLKAEYPTGFDPPSEAAPLAATIAVLVGPDGHVKAASVYKSSGYLPFDAASVRAAKASKYRPQLVDCKPVEATYYFKTSLTPSGPP